MFIDPNLKKYQTKKNKKVKSIKKVSKIIRDDESRESLINELDDLRKQLDEAFNN